MTPWDFSAEGFAGEYFEIEKFPGKDNYAAVSMLFMEFGKFLSDRAKCVYLALRSYAAGKDAVVFPSYKTLAARSGYNPRKLCEGIDELERFGWVKRTTPSESKKPSNRYKFTEPALYGQKNSKWAGMSFIHHSPTKEEALDYKREMSAKKGKSGFEKKDISPVRNVGTSPVRNRAFHPSEMVPFHTGEM